MKTKDKPIKAQIYYDGKVIHTIIGYRSENKPELHTRVRTALAIVIEE